MEQYGIRFAPEPSAGPPYPPELVSAAAEQGRKAERDRIFEAAKEQGLQLTREIASIISGESERESQIRQEERERLRRALAQNGSFSDEEIARLLPD